MSTLSVSIDSPDANPRPAVPRQRHGRGWLERHGDVRLLKVAGSFREMGEQHGVLLRDDVLAGPLPYFRSFVERILRGSLGGGARLAWPLLQRTVGRGIARNLPAFATDTLRGLAEGAGLEWQAALDAATMPDAFVWLVARINQLSGRGPAVAHRLALGIELGCTSAVAWGDATADGKLLHARNFDYHGVECWPRTKALVIHEPDDGMRYVSAAAAGVPLGGITAMNEAGLTLAVHQHMFSTGAALGGMPIGVVGDMVMREARDLDEAQRILEAHRPIGAWTYIVTDGRRREVLCFEENPKRRAARRFGGAGGTFGYANIYLDPDLGATESNLFGSYWRHNLGRHTRVNGLLEERAGSLDPQGMAEILGDAGVACRVSDSIAMVLTTGSVVFCPEDGWVWMGTGDTPTSHGTFEPFSLGEERPAPEAGKLHVGGDIPVERRDAFDHFRRAYVQAVDHEDRAAALAELERATQLDAGEPLYHFLAGLLALATGDAAAAEARFDAALDRGHPHAERVASFHLWRGRARDVLGRRDAAVADYRACLGYYADPPVHAAARRNLRRPYRAAQARQIRPEMGLADVIHP